MFVADAWRGSSPRGRLPRSMSVASARPVAAAAGTLPPLEMPALPPRGREEPSFVEGSRYASAPEPVRVQYGTGEIVPSLALVSGSRRPSQAQTTSTAAGDGAGGFGSRASDSPKDESLCSP